MIRLMFLIFIGLPTSVLFAQTVRELKPELGRIPDLSPAHQKAIDRRDLLMGKESPTEAEQQEMDKLLSVYGEMVESIWDVESGGCSWYCGGGPYKVISSSALATQKDNTYDGHNAHDLSFRNAWVEGIQGYGVGEYLEYYFKNGAPRITEIKVFNGYVKTDKAWQENSRVKKLKVTVNGKPYAMLNLTDTKAEQIFKIQPLGGKTSDGKDLILRFTVEDVYKGSKYDDTCITEIYFDGLDVHCFARGTRVTLHNGQWKNIEHLAEGDTVLTFDQYTGNFRASIIEKLEMAYHKDLVKYIFEDGSFVIATQDHPFLLDLKGWSSLKPDLSKHYNGFENVGQVAEGDRFMMRNADGKPEILELRRIEIIQQAQETFTISKLSGATCFIANGFIVGVETLQLID